MLCPNCGIDVGDRLQYCQGCEESPAVPRPAPQAAAVEYQQRPQRIEDVLRQPPVLAALALVTTLVAFLWIYLSQSEQHLGHAAVLSLVTVFSLVSLCAWGQMWLELLHDNFLIALVYLLVPIGVYSLVITYPERAMKPFKIHAFANGMMVILLTAYWHLGGTVSVETLLAI